jgi:tetratricopeptide (TPR) repeat protein
MVEFRGALDIDPRYALARYELAKALERQNKIREATAEYCRALKDDPSLVQIYYRLYRSYTRLGQKDKAQEALKAFRAHQQTKQPAPRVPPSGQS